MLYFLAFLGRVFISNSQIFLGSKWQFCFSTGKGKMLENFSQYLWTSVLHTSTWIFRNVIAILLGGPRTHNILLSISVVLCRLLPLAVELDCIGAGDIVDRFFLHVAIRSLHVAALVVILGGGVNVVSGVAHPVLPCKAPLDLVSLLERLVVDSLHEVADQLVHIKADTLDIGLNDPGAVFEQFRLASLLVLCPAGLLSV